LDEQEAGVYPVAGEGLPGEGLRLRDLALVVGEPEVLTTPVEVYRLAEVLLRHHGALEVPAGEAPAEGGVPLHEVAGVLLPEREVAGVPLLLVHDDGARGGGGADVELLGLGVAGELAVVGEGGDVEVDAVVGLVGVALPHERLGGEDLLADVLGGAGADGGLAEVERAPVG